MNDYLTQLVTRSLDRAATVRPRPKSLFAPEQAVVQPLVESEPFFVATNDEAMPRAAHDRPPPAREAFDSLLPRGEQPWRAPDAASAVPRRDRSPAPPHSPEAAAGAAPLSKPIEVGRQAAQVSPRRSQASPPQLPAAPPTPVAENGPHGHAGSLQPAPMPQHSTIEPVVAPEPLSPVVVARPRLTADDGPGTNADSLRPAPTRMPGRSAIEPTVAREPSRAPDAPHPEASPVEVAQPRGAPVASSQLSPAHARLSIAEPPARTEPAAIQPASLLIAEPFARPESSAVQPAWRSAPPSVTPQAAPAEPTIHVTIGRIEVRATPPPAPAAHPKSAPTPAMSLDDYLRTRGGGRR